jgi:hypothetical protein
MRAPLRAIRSSWRPDLGILRPTGRAVEFVLGIVLLALGAVLAFSGFFAFIGVPMMALGLYLIVRGTTQDTPTA